MNLESIDKKYGDFYGFSFNGVHSSQLGILKVSSGSRYTENTLPNFQDETAALAGTNEVYYFNTHYQQKVIQVLIAFDSMTEEQYRLFRNVYNGRVEGDLIFDEAPYKIYRAKIQNSPQLKTICFDVETNSNGIERVYKGEGSISFVCYYPFATCIHKSLSDSFYEDYGNINEWKDASGLLESEKSCIGNNISIYNPGDLDIDWIAYYQVSNLQNLTKIELKYLNKTYTLINFKPFPSSGIGSTHIGINSRTQLIEGYNKINDIYVKDNSIYNYYINDAIFSKIPVTPDSQNCATFESTNISAEIKYNFLYF